MSDDLLLGFLAFLFDRRRRRRLTKDGFFDGFLLPFSLATMIASSFSSFLRSTPHFASALSAFGLSTSAHCLSSASSLARSRPHCARSCSALRRSLPHCCSWSA